MTLALLHTPAWVVCQLLIDLGLGADPISSPGDPWPTYKDGEPSTPDNVLTVYDTAPLLHGRSQPDGEMLQHYGIQVRIRGKDMPTSFTKAEAIRLVLNETVRLAGVTITQQVINAIVYNAATYLVHCCSGTTLVRMGKEMPNARRSLYTLNTKVALKRTI